LKPQIYFEISLCGNKLRGASLKEASGFFLAHQVPPGSIAVFQHQGRFRCCVYLRSRNQIIRLKKAHRQDPPKRLKLNIKKLGPKQWLHKWKEDYHTQPLAAKFILIPAWESASIQPSKRIPVIVEPGSAFGSGTHETTRLSVKLMESLEGRFRDFFDVGTGTGVLSVVAAKLGAERVVGIDHDEAAVRAARKNAKLNGIRKAAFSKRDFRSFQRSRRYDLIAANLWPALLLNQRKQFSRMLKPGHFLVLSGILKIHEKKFLKNFRQPRLRCLRIVRGRRWIAVCYQLV